MPGDGEIIRHESGLVWYPEKGLGYYPVMPDGVYNEDYWQKYVGYAKTEMGIELTRRRIALVEKYAPRAKIVDIGIGCGQFVETRGKNTYGFDVNPIGIRWLIDRGLWWNPYETDPENVTCWDSLEHIDDAARLVRAVRRFLFVSLPVFEDMNHVLRSKHFRKDEHYHYFTPAGFRRWMHDLGFSCLEENSMEVEIGRENIGTFVFERSVLTASN